MITALWKVHVQHKPTYALFIFIFTQGTDANQTQSDDADVDSRREQRGSRGRGNRRQRHAVTDRPTEGRHTM